MREMAKIGCMFWPITEMLQVNRIKIWRSVKIFSMMRVNNLVYNLVIIWNLLEPVATKLMPITLYSHLDINMM